MFLITDPLVPGSGCGRACVFMPWENRRFSVLTSPVEDLDYPIPEVEFTELLLADQGGQEQSPH